LKNNENQSKPAEEKRAAKYQRGTVIWLSWRRKSKWREAGESVASTWVAMAYRQRGYVKSKLNLAGWRSGGEKQSMASLHHIKENIENISWRKYGNDVMQSINVSAIDNQWLKCYNRACTNKRNRLAK